MSIYAGGDLSVKPLLGLVETLTRSRPKGGTLHNRAGWTNQVRLLRALVTATYEQVPAGAPADADEIGTDVIDHVNDLDREALHVLRLTFSMLWKLSQRRQPSIGPMPHATRPRRGSAASSSRAN
jgi:hypothetical protein